MTSKCSHCKVTEKKLRVLRGILKRAKDKMLKDQKKDSSSVSAEYEALIWTVDAVVKEGWHSSLEGRKWIK